MNDEVIAYQLGRLTGTIIFLLLLSQLIHWIVRKIRRKPRKQFRDWLTSWIAGPELFLFGALWVGIHTNNLNKPFSFLLGVALVLVGCITFIIKIIAFILSCFRRPAPLSPPVG
jgi:apolipoprotein N-acyltransferase